MSHPTDAFDAKCPIFILTRDGEIVPEESREGLETLVAFQHSTYPGTAGNHGHVYPARVQVNAFRY